MPREFKPLPPDHPIFSIGVGFVFRNDPPEDEAELEHEHESGESDED